MSQRSLRLGPLLTALALLVTGCAPAASGSSEAGSSSQEEFPPAVSEVAMQEIGRAHV